MDWLTHVPLFNTLSLETREKIARAALLRHFQPGESILIEGEAGQGAYFILEGEVRVFRLSVEGREQVLATLKPGASFNTVGPLLDGQPHPASARAITETRLAALRSADYLDLLRTCPDFSFVILREFAGRLAHLTGLVENLALHSVRGRMAKFLLAQADGEALHRRWTQDEIAEHLGSVRDVIGRTLREFVDAGYIRREGHRIVLVDREGLEREAQY